jgi:hypothetical protein
VRESLLLRSGTSREFPAKPQSWKAYVMGLSDLV